MRRRQFVRAAAGGSGVGIAGCFGRPADTGTPTDVEIDLREGTPVDPPTDSASPTPADAPTASPTSTPESRLEFESEHWEALRDRREYLFVDGAVHNPLDYSVEAEIVVAGWFDDDDCTGSGDGPDWIAGPRYVATIPRGGSWTPRDPWTIALAVFRGCGYRSPQLWSTGVSRA